MRFPSIKDLAISLREVSANVEGECDVRLQVANWGWKLNWGPSAYDTDHAGFWGASRVPGVVGGRVVRFAAGDVAKDLLAQAKEHYHGSQ